MIHIRPHVQMMVFIEFFLNFNFFFIFFLLNLFIEASLLVKCSGTLTRLNLISLFNLIPGLLEIKLLNVATVHENNEGK